MIHQIETVRDQVAGAYSPSPANLRDGRREQSIDRVQTSEALVQDCRVLAAQVHDGARLLPEQVSEALKSLEAVNEMGMVAS